MINHQVALVALRNRALTLSVCTTGALTGVLSATTTGYARSSGSFVTDGFVVGQEVTPTGFAQTDVGIVTAVSALTLTILGGRTAESPAGAASLAVGLPALRAWENLDFTPTASRWFVEEDYLPGPAAQVALGPRGEMELLPTYVLKLYGLTNHSTAALYKAADALLTLFAPRTSLTLSTGDTIIVRTNPAPYRSQLLPGAPGWAMVALTVPCVVRSANSI